MRRPLLSVLILAAVLASLTALRAAGQTVLPSRTQDGRPNFNGIWQVLNTAAWDIQDHHAQWGVPAGQGVVEGNELPYQPWALAKKQENFKSRHTADPVEARGFLPGVPRIMYLPFPLQIAQTQKYVVIVSEYSRAQRIIYTDGSRHPAGPLDFWMGDSRGRWEGDTLVTDVIHFNDQSWFDRAGNFHSDALHLVERFTPMGPDHINYEVTVEDTKVFTRPWKMRMPLYRRKDPNVRILEYEAGTLLLEEEARREAEQKGR